MKGKIIKDEGRCCIAIVLTQVDEATTCIEFHKKNVKRVVFFKGLMKNREM